MPRQAPTDPYHSGTWSRVRKLVLERDRHICQINGPRCKGEATTVDHIISWRHGGAWYDPANLRAACGTCNYGRPTVVTVDTTTASAPSRDW